MKYTKFNDIPQFIQCGHWECDFGLDDVWWWINRKCDQGMPLDMNPLFQRAHVWTEEQQVAWLEFFLRGGKTGRIIYLNKPDWSGFGRLKKNAYNEFVVVDGKQRLEAIRKFTLNEIKVFGSYLNEFTDNIRRVNHTIKININDLKSEKEVIEWYLQMNTGGTPHTQQEIERIRRLLNE